MVLAYLGRIVSIDEIQNVTGPTAHGATALDLLDAGRQFGLIGRGVKVDAHQLHLINRGAILHWEFRHFVVFDRLTRAGVRLVDPAFGQREVSVDQFRKAFTGVALLFTPSESFTARKPERKRARYLRLLLDQKSSLVHILCMSVLVQTFALALPSLTGAVVDRVVPNGDRSLLGILAGGMTAMILFHLLSSWIRAHLVLQMRSAVDLRMMLTFVNHLVHLPLPFFQSRSTGDLINRLASNTAVREILTSSTLSAVLDGVLVLAYVLLLFASSWIFGALALALALAQITVYVITRQRQRDLMAADLETSARARGFEIEMFAGIQALKAMGVEDRAVQHWSTLFVDVMNVSLARGRLQAVVDSIIGSLRMGSPLVLLCVGTVLVLDGSLSLGQMLALNALAIGFLTPVSNLVASAFQLQLVGAYLDRVDDVLCNRPEQQPFQHSVRPKLAGRIEVEDVSFQFGANSPPVLTGVSLRIEAGQFVAIVGHSGAGKSTLANLLLGLYIPTEGVVRFDGIDLRQLSLQHVRSQIGVVLQNPSLFHGDIRRNIAFANPQIAMERVVLAAQRAQIHDEIMALPMGYDTIISETAATLSGGQRQRIAIARALVEEPSMLLLDEATNSLDPRTEKAVQAAISSLNCTRVVIAHRLSTIRAADVILVMHRGRLTERGNHEQLVRLDGQYARLVKEFETPETFPSA